MAKLQLHASALSFQFLTFKEYLLLLLHLSIEDS
jgi:hypothetical protein